MGEIADRNVRDAVETIAHEFSSMEDLVEDLNQQVSNLEQENSDLACKVEELEEKINELEEALAEAYLTSLAKGEEDDG